MIHTFHVTKDAIRRAPLTLTLLGTDHEQEPVMRPQGMRTWQWFYCRKGRGECILNGQRYLLNEGSGLMLPPEMSHSYKAVTGGWTLDFIGFTGNNCAQILKTLRLSQPGLYSYTGRDLFSDYAGRIIEADGLKASSRERALSSLCYDFLFSLSQGVRFTDLHEAAGENEIVRAAVDYLEEHCSEVLSLDALSEALHFSKGYIQALFKKEMGHSVITHLQRIRISRARRFLIEDPEKKVLDIARECGFASPGYFGLVFKRETGKTPEEFRKG